MQRIHSPSEWVTWLPQRVNFIFVFQSNNNNSVSSHIFLINTVHYHNAMAEQQWYTMRSVQCSAVRDNCDSMHASNVTQIYCAFEWLPILNGCILCERVGSNEWSLATRFNLIQLNEQDMSKHEATKLPNTRSKASFVLQPTTYNYTMLHSIGGQWHLEEVRARVRLCCARAVCTSHNNALWANAIYFVWMHCQWLLWWRFRLLFFRWVCSARCSFEQALCRHLPVCYQGTFGTIISLTCVFFLRRLLKTSNMHTHTLDNTHSIRIRMFPFYFILFIIQYW